MSFRSCMSCKSCMDMHPAYCSNIMALNAMGRRDDGSSAFKDATGAEVISHFFGQSSFSSAVVADEKSLVKVDAAYDLSVLAPLGCGIDRKSVVSGKSVSVRVDIGGRRIITKKTRK